MEHILKLELDQHPIDPDINKHQFKIMLEIAQIDNIPCYTLLEGERVRGYKEDDLRKVAKDIGVTEEEVLEAFFLFKGLRVKMENTYLKELYTYPFVSEITEKITMNLMSCGEIDQDARDYDEDFPEPSGCFEVHDYIYCYNASVFDFMQLSYMDIKNMIMMINTGVAFNRLEARFNQGKDIQGNTVNSLIEVRVWSEKTQ